MTGCSLKEDFRFSPEIAQRLDNFFANVANSASPSRTDNIGFPPDTEERTGNDEDWDPFSQNTENLENEDTSDVSFKWLLNVNLNVHSGMDYILAYSSSRYALMGRSPLEDKKIEIIQMATPSFEGFDEETQISCASLFGLGSNRKSETMDCLCIAIGTNNGQVGVFTEKGTLIFVERFANTEIITIKFDQFSNFQHISVVTKDEIFSVNPFSLLSALSQAKAALARGEKSVRELSDILEIEVERLEPEGRSLISDVVMTGIQKPTAFDQYVTASASSYMRKVERSALPHYSTYFLCSSSTFGHFLWHEGGEGDGIWSDAINKISKSIVPHFGLRRFLGWTNDDTRKTWAIGRTKKVALIRNSFGESRTVEWVCRAPRRNLIAVVDNHARVILIDTHSRQIIRIWKGYRDASCGFITAEENGKSALFLAIFAPRRGLLEIWSCQNGVRVGARHISSRARLIEGGAEVIVSGSLRVPSSDVSTWLIYPDGSVHKIVVPFHVALARTTSHDEHDQLVLNKLRIPDITPSNRDLFLKTFATLKTAKGRRQVVLQILPVLDNTELFDELLREIEKLESSQSLGELLPLFHRLNDVYSELSFSIDHTECASELNFPIKGELKELLNQHIKRERYSSDLCSFSLGHFLSLIDFQNSVTSLFTRNIPDIDVLRLGHFIFDLVFVNGFKKELYESIMAKLPFSQNDIVSLLCLIWTRSPTVPSLTEVNGLTDLVRLYGKEGYWDTFEKAYVECENCDRSFVLFAVLSYVRFNIDKERDENYLKQGEQNLSIDPDDEAIDIHEEDKMLQDREMDESGDWESVDPESETVGCTLRLIHSLSLLSRLHSSIKQQSYSKMASTGKGYFREQVARMVVATSMNPSELRDLLVVPEEQIKDLDGDLAHPLRALSSSLPLSLSFDSLLCDCAWEYVSTWSRNKEMDVQMLELGIEYMSAISCMRLQHGICRIVWDTFLGEFFKSLACLMDKTGRSPKDREARQILRITDVQVISVLRSCVSVLMLLRENVRDSPSPISVHYEEWIEMSFVRPPACLRPAISSRDSLIEMAVRQSLVNYHLVLHHIHLGRVLQLQLQCAVRVHAMRSLFDSLGQRAFFNPLTSHPLIPLDRVDESLVEERMKWIDKISNQGGVAERKLARELCSEWSIKVDAIGLAQSIAFLRNGSDEEAAREYSTVDDQSSLGENIARILAARVLQLSMERNTVMPTSHFGLLKDLAGDEVDRVLCPDGLGWLEAVILLGKSTSSLNVSSSIHQKFVKLNQIVMQNFGARFI